MDFSCECKSDGVVSSRFIGEHRGDDHLLTGVPTFLIEIVTILQVELGHFLADINSADGDSGVLPPGYSGLR